jgi:hypothetical protein
MSTGDGARLEAGRPATVTQMMVGGYQNPASGVAVDGAAPLQLDARLPSPRFSGVE